jgi:hypothetical protein
MQELIQQLQEKAGLTTEQAAQAIDVMKEFVKSKVPPFIGSAVDKWFDTMDGKPDGDQPGFVQQAGDFLDEVKDNVEDWTNQAKEKVSDLLDKQKKEGKQ